MRVLQIQQNPATFCAKQNLGSKIPSLELCKSWCCFCLATLRKTLTPWQDPKFQGPLTQEVTCAIPKRKFLRVGTSGCSREMSGQTWKKCGKSIGSQQEQNGRSSSRLLKTRVSRISVTQKPIGWLSVDYLKTSSILIPYYSHHCL